MEIIMVMIFNSFWWILKYVSFTVSSVHICYLCYMFGGCFVHIHFDVLLSLFDVFANLCNDVCKKNIMPFIVFIWFFSISSTVKDRETVKYAVLGRPILLALKEVDGTPSFLEKALRFIEVNGRFLSRTALSQQKA